MRPTRFSILRTGFLLSFATLLASCGSSSSVNQGTLFRNSIIPATRAGDFDLTHLKLDVDVNHATSRVEGTVSYTLMILDPALDSLRFDAGPAIQVSSVTSKGSPLQYSRTDRMLSIARPPSFTLGVEQSLEVSFTSIDPERGIYFRRKSDAPMVGRDQVWTQGEPTDHHDWFPLPDRPSDLMTTELIARVREDWSLFSNGTLLGTTPRENGRKEWHYRMEKPHAPYLIVLAAGDYLITRDSARGVALEYWTYPDMPEKVEPTFGQTGDMIKYFDSLLGTPYPWGVYRQIVVHDYMYGGMENTSATVLTEALLVDEREKIDINPTSTIAHEIAHQWFGDLVTARSWDHLWIHESFATYLAARYIGSRFGEERFDRTMGRYRNQARRADASELGPDPIALGNNRPAMIYGRGALLLHSLNYLIGDDAFTEGMQLFLKRHKHGNVETEDLQRAFEESSGQNLDWFFQQWIYGKDMPVMSLARERKIDSIRYRIAQEPRYGNTPEIFRLIADVIMVRDRGDGSDGEKMVLERETLTIEEDWVYTKWYPDRPNNQFMIFGPGVTQLVEIEYEPESEEMWDLMHAAPSATDRYEAAGALAGYLPMMFRNAREGARASIAQGIAIRMPEEPVADVREALVFIAAASRTAVGIDVVRDAMKDPSTSVRRSTVAYYDLLGGKEEVRYNYEKFLQDSSLDLQATTIALFVEAEVDLTESELEHYSTIIGPRGAVARAWMSAVARQKERDFLPRLIEYAQEGSVWLARSAMRALGEFGAPNEEVRNAAIRGILSGRANLVSASYELAERLDDPTLNARIEEVLATLSEEEREEIEEAR